MGHMELSKTAVPLLGHSPRALRTIGLSVAVAAALSACADMSSKSQQPKAIDADAPLAKSASSLAKGEIEADEVLSLIHI